MFKKIRILSATSVKLNHSGNCVSDTLVLHSPSSFLTWLLDRCLLAHLYYWHIKCLWGTSSYSTQQAQHLSVCWPLLPLPFPFSGYLWILVCWCALSTVQQMSYHYAEWCFVYSEQIIKVPFSQPLLILFFIFPFHCLTPASNLTMQMASWCQDVTLQLMSPEELLHSQGVQPSCLAVSSL